MSRCLNAAILMAYALSGCATMSPEECLQANWEEVGYNDAVGGYPVSRSSEHREACASTGVTVDFALYRNGHALGLPYYCTRETGFETADHGGDFATQCRRETSPEYVLGYSEGLDVFALKTEMRKIEIQIDEKPDQAEALLIQIGQLRTARDNPELSKEARYQLSQLDSLYSTLNQDIEWLNRARDDVFEEIDALTAAFYRSL
tara:strand:- start:12 stop:623 length:612 start_codon:yes stop_codon:yes gene_type:complete